ncbi:MULTISPECIES: tryptophan synthase subunit alpha [Archaeoglobus]|jgi:tryptophan synthase alpha chain|uniref:Tryptophan synthase alpha chain n=3 Tax=Archaeoglobus fulgidus TaxID=2234 RepID=TRPA_ARCFU|nr:MULTISPECIES: tryptophan synthase subunit alpha [Archaeoglobus]O28673.1 RecName: Full=Tryptophan synthase alpha chain [Archaeoglobus fulgidus DSM 4304]AAB89650.1 tryptophan synthase, subunit alpha (trpA) [Archaeoglobus fulgidus DSM 4304]AIG98604.1 tryptophan synthase, alpha subunit [Archaeoglobus fulgidus DSM 8774]KUJ93830.1 MAG: Tryptophan synthase alpha chain [Archaeoglobus fulgidus]KUK07285.1 MAG: Tryptophan synthase alpha chain [Archaeoglobus fulgidus]MDI3497141.1 tryptophan synthase a
MIDRSLIVFFTACYPTAEKTVEFMLTAAESGADVIELGVPFSDPVADGKTIQESYVRALRNFRVERVFEIAKAFRAESDKPLVLMSYYNPIYRRGVESFVEKAYSSGIDAMLVVDLPYDEAGDFVEVCSRTGMKNVFLAAPNTPEDRLRAMDELSAFVYLVSTYGVTGERDRISPLAFEALKRAKGICRKPVAVGFGVSKADHVRQLISAGADGVVVGSAFVRLINEKGERATEDIRALTENLRSGLV